MQLINAFNDYRQSRKTRLWSISASVILCLVLLVSQSIELGHSHDGDLSIQPDCQICLKIGSHDDSIAVDGSVIDFDSSHDLFAELLHSESFLTLPATKSRAPPLA